MDDNANNNQELAELLEQLGIDQEETQKITTDIRTGDKLLNGYTTPAVPGPLRRRVQEALDQRLRRRARMQWVGRVAAVLLIGLALSGLWYQHREMSGDVYGPSAEQGARLVARPGEEPLTLAELALLQEEQDYLDEPMDDLALTELMFLFEDAELLQDDSLGKEYDHETLYADGCDIDCWIA